VAAVRRPSVGPGDDGRRRRVDCDGGVRRLLPAGAAGDAGGSDDRAARGLDEEVGRACAIQRVAVRRPCIGGGFGAPASAAQRKFSAWSMLPLPTYVATCGYGHSGLVRSTPAADMCIAVMWAGARPLRVH